MTTRTQISFLRDSSNRTSLNNDYRDSAQDVASFAPTTNVILTKLRLVRRDNQLGRMQDFGDAGKLSNGFRMQMRSNGTVLIDFTDGLNIQSSAHLAMLGEVQQIEGADPSSHTLFIFSVDLARRQVAPGDQRQGVMLRKGESVAVLLQDDLRALNDLAISIEHYPA